MRQRRAAEVESVGRHRSPWGRSNRILPIRWGRIIAAVVTAVVVVSGLILVHGLGPGRPSPTAEPAGSATTMVTPAPGEPTPDPPGQTSPGSTVGPSAGAVGSTGPSGAAGAAGAVGADARATDAGSPPRAGTTPATSRPAATPRAGASTTPASRPAGPVLGLSSSDVAFGDVESTISVELIGVGTAPARVSVGATPAWLSAVPHEGVVDPGARVPLVITLNRATAPPGPVDVFVPVAAVDGSGGGKLHVTANVSGAPELRASLAPAEIVTANCPADRGSTQAIVSATVVDPTGVFGVEVRTRAPDGTASTNALGLVTATDDRSTWSGPIGPVPTAGTMSYTVVATDLDGRRSEVTGSVEVRACSGG
ncbi:hypothetical protein Ga0074812_13939 [Parafrankia irregularis]|uniref:Uncharacterized protein n=1 Tax=Parafrankia irregularis TaxID=795642 RepID=A0A0S4QXU7_9ACTN|nr:MULTISPECIES: hypothetical protein [Parafrankia]MBE3206396.1 hypothetical protein [Parafrankia sp. CH37]CUU60405.1 hypothetical protein Ga0074812_13939 [Parafrankia irregularis]